MREEFILRKDEILKGEFKNKGDSPEKPSPGKKEELPSTSVRKFNTGTEIKDSLKVWKNYILFPQLLYDRRLLVPECPVLVTNFQDE